MNSTGSTPTDPSSEIREQFDLSPYPNTPLDDSPSESLDLLFIHNLVTSYYYRNQQTTETEGRVILDAGCGSGYKSLILAEANPGARIVGVDLSAESVRLAQKRLKHHGFNNAEFHLLPIERLSELKQQFDYINCDETLYLLPDPIAGLKSLRSALKPEGVLRANFHSQLQRAVYFRAQEVGGLMGLMAGANQQTDMAMFRSLMKQLKKSAPLKSSIWNAEYETDDESLLANHLLRGDKGMTIPEFLAAIRAADLEFIRMVDWQTWELSGLFEKPDELPDELTAIFAEKTIEETLHLYELINPRHRLLDVWCGIPQREKPIRPINEWESKDWKHATISLHPQLKKKKIRDKLIGSALTLRKFDFNELVPLRGGSACFDTLLQSSLLPLWESPQQFLSLVSRWQQLQPINPVTLAPRHDREAFMMVKRMVIGLVNAGYLLAYLPQEA